jgi:hypothetical protein
MIRLLTVIIAVLLAAGSGQADVEGLGTPTVEGQAAPTVEGISHSGGTAWMFTDGFESPWNPPSNLGNWTSVSGTPTAVGSPVAQGSVAMSTDAVEYMTKTLPAAQTEIWADFWVYLASETGSVHQIWKLNATGGGSWIYASVTNLEQLRITDGTNTYDTGVTLSTGVYQHVYIHIKLAASGAETIQVAVNSVTGWDYSIETATIIPGDFLVLVYGRITAPSAETFIFDEIRLANGASMPVEW